MKRLITRKKFVSDEEYFLSELTREADLDDRSFPYQKPESLQYYLCLEPAQWFIVRYDKNVDGAWMTNTYTGENNIIN